MNNMLGQPIDINSKLFNELSELEKKEIIFNHFYFMREVCQFLKFLDDNGAPDEVIDYMNVLGTYAQQDSKYIHRVSRYITS